MQNLPHNYVVSSRASARENIELTSPGLAALDAAPPAEFGGPGDLWSPETLLAASVASCFILTFRAVARASKLEWTELVCDVDAVLDRVDRVTRFTEIREQVVLDVPAGTDEAKALRLLEKAKQACLVTSSLSAEIKLEAKIRVAA